MAQCATDANGDHTGPDVEEDVGQEEEPSRLSALPSNLRPPPNCERKSIVNPIFAGAGSRMNRSWPNISAEHRASLASSVTDTSSGEEIEMGWPDGDASRQSARVSTAPTPDGLGRQADWGISSGPLTAHPSSWAGYGGAAAWVRSSSRDTTPMSKGSKGGARRGHSRF